MKKIIFTTLFLLFSVPLVGAQADLAVTWHGRDGNSLRHVQASVTHEEIHDSLSKYVICHYHAAIQSSSAIIPEKNYTWSTKDSLEMSELVVALHAISQHSHCFTNDAPHQELHNRVWRFIHQIDAQRKARGL